MEARARMSPATAKKATQRKVTAKARPAPKAEKKPAPQSVTIELPGWKLHEFLTNAAVAASSDEMRPPLTCTQITRSKDTLTAVSTDSYRLAKVDYVLADGPAEPVTSLLPYPGSAARLLKAAGVISRKNEVMTTLTLNGAVEISAGEVAIKRQATYDYPNWANLVPAEEKFDGKRAGFNPAFLGAMARFKLGTEGNLNTVLDTLNELKPARWTITAHGYGSVMYLLMPVRLAA